MSDSGVRAGQAFVEVGLKEKLKEGIRQIQNQLSAVSASMRSFGTSVAQAGLAGTAAFGGALAAIGAVGLKFAQAGSELDDMAQRTGIAAESLSALAYAAQLSGTEIGAVEKSVTKMQKTLAEAAQGSQSAQASLAELGLSVGQLKNLSVEKQFAAIAGAIAKIENPTMRNAAAMAVFGKSATEIVPLIRGDIKSLIQEAHALGVVMSGSDVEAAAKLGDAMDKLGAVFGALINTVGAAISGPMTMFIDVTSAIASEVTKFIGANRGLTVAIGAVALAGTAAAASVMLIGGALFGAAAGIAGLVAAGPAIAAGFTALTGALATIGPALGVLAAGVAANLALAGAFVYVAARAGILQPVISGLMDLFGKLTATTSQTFNGIAAAVSAGNITQAVQILWAGIKVAFFTGAKAAYDGFVWLVDNGTKLMLKFAVAVGQTIGDIFGQIPAIIQAALTGNKSVIEIIAATLKGNLGNILDDQIGAAQAELNKLTAGAGGSSQGSSSPSAGGLTVASDTSAADASKKAFQDRAQALRDEITEMKLGADAAELLKLKQQGLNQEQLAAVQQLQAQRNALAAQQKAKEESDRKAAESKRKAEQDRQQLIDRGKQMAEEVRTPFEVLQAKMAEIANMESGGFIDKQTAVRQRELAMGDFQAPMRDAIKSGRNTVAEINSQAALDIILRNQRTFGMGPTMNKKNLQEEYAKQSRDYLRIVAENLQKQQKPQIVVKNNRI